MKWLDCVEDIIRTPPGCREYNEAEYKMHFKALEFYPVPVTGTGDAETKKNIIAATIGWIIKRTTNLSKDLITKTLFNGVIDAYRLRAGRRLNEGMARLSDPVVLVFRSEHVAGSVLGWRQFLREHRDVMRDYIPGYCREQWAWLHRRSMAFREYFASKGLREQIVSQVRLNWETKEPELLLKYPGGGLEKFDPKDGIEEETESSSSGEEEDVAKP